MADPIIAKEDQRLTVLLAEFSALRSEIQYRSEFQHRALQLHIAVFTVVLPVFIAAVSTAANQSHLFQFSDHLHPGLS